MGRNKTKRAKAVYRCEICQGEQDEPVVACDICDKWYHFRCIGVKSVNKKDVWICTKCKPENPKTSTSQLPIPEVTINHQVTTPHRDVQSSPIDNGKQYDLRYHQNHPYNPERQNVQSTSNQNLGSVSNRQLLSRQQEHFEKTSSGISSSSKAMSYRQQVELQINEEERQLQERRDRHYLEQKYLILMERAHSQKHTDVSYVSRSDKTYTKNWVDEQHQRVNDCNKYEMTDEFIKRINALEVKADSKKDETKSQCNPTSQNDNNNSKYEKCKICHMIGAQQFFGACLLCSKQCHFACMDKTIM